jgi:hypothetical protein
MRSFSLDVITRMDDNDLFRTTSDLKQRLFQMRRNGLPKRKSQGLEIEICYFQREEQIRKARKEAHKVFLERQRR